MKGNEKYERKINLRGDKQKWTSPSNATKKTIPYVLTLSSWYDRAGPKTLSAHVCKRPELTINVRKVDLEELTLKPRRTFWMSRTDVCVFDARQLEGVNSCENNHLHI